MSIPPFPSQDLAKLVLGYLAEEQLMTAYDEFLQASPYLDALRNEYDRIFMTSLKSILAEYRAVKIYVDTCKPFALRKKIFQCSNLLEIVKFLVANVDIKKLQQESSDKTSTEKQNVTVSSKQAICELCHSLSLPSCVCKHRTDVQKPECTGYGEGSLLQSSVETTPLADLPGNHVTTRKKHVKTLEKDSVFGSTVSSLQSSDPSAKQSYSSNISPEEYLARCENSPAPKSTDNSSVNLTIKPIESSKSNQNIEEFNKVLKSVVSRNATLCSSESTSNQRISNAGTFQDFASGVAGGESQTATYSVPDSSTSENVNVRLPVTKPLYNSMIKAPSQCQLMLQIGHVNASEMKSCKTPILPNRLLPKTIENQIKIISDVKVDKKLSEKLIKKSGPIPTNATSTPLMQMHTIMINGTPAYKHTSSTFTKDEIMAMPTVIVVPASGPPTQVPTSAHGDPIVTPNTDVPSEANTSPRKFSPLVIDVPPNAAVVNKLPMEALPDLDEQKPAISDLVKTVDSVDLKNSNITTTSVPKDNVISLVTNTPQMLPPKRKSSSTPRRSSHIRVLDFTTPRRILHETINEHVPSQSSVPPVEVVGDSQNVKEVPADEPETMNIKSSIVVVVEEESSNNDAGSSKENESAIKPKPTKKYNWDADLRALVANEKPLEISHRKPKKRISKKKKSDKLSASKEAETKKKIKRKQSPKAKKTVGQKVKKEEDESPAHPEPVCNVQCKPNIKIICGGKKKTDSNSNKNKPNEKTEECNDTPETERLTLQNEIGGKLNLSDLLETPYKQAMYDIQMETPRFLGPDLPDEPLSDIKIMNIPTPRFFNTPSLAQATPSSYSSRPTDYSSGGSYYKPDDQDYMPIPDLTTCPVSSSKEEDISVDQPIEKDNTEKKTRPVRKCAKNVSYYNNSGAVKRSTDNDDANSSSSEMSINISSEFKSKKETTQKTPRAQSTSKIVSRKRTSIPKKIKSPKESIAKDKKSFMKIKPKHTPKSHTPVKTGKRKMQSPHSKGYPSVQRKRTTSKENVVEVTSTMVPAATKSRRKSSTPRKLHCTKTFNSEVCRYNSPNDNSDIKPSDNNENTSSIKQESDSEQITLRWSDEGSEDGKTKDVPTKTTSKEPEDITQIQKFILASVPESDRAKDLYFQRNLMIRGFDSTTAQNIERDFFDDNPLPTMSTNIRTLTIPIEATKPKQDEVVKTAESTETSKPQVEADESDGDEIELSVHDCNEESNNYFVFKHDDTKEVSNNPPIKIKDNFTMEICLDDVTMRLIAPPFKLLVDQDLPTVDEIDYSYKETELAVKSISSMDKLYTPMKDDYKSQCYEIFDSTLTSLDTPLKPTSSAIIESNVTVTELVLEGEKSERKEIADAKKRKRARSSSNDSANSMKRTKPDADLLLKAANIQNIDIETVLTKLHGH